MTHLAHFFGSNIVAAKANTSIGHANETNGGVHHGMWLKAHGFDAIPITVNLSTEKKTTKKEEEKEEEKELSEWNECSNRCAKNVDVKLTV